MGYYCGIDLGNKEAVICVLQGNRQMVAEECFTTTATGVSDCSKKLRGLTCREEASPHDEGTCAADCRCAV